LQNPTNFPAPRVIARTTAPQTSHSPLTATLVAALAKGAVIAIDGKSLKGAYEKARKVRRK